MLAALPKLAELYLPMLMSVTAAQWPTAHEPWVMAAQVEKESCISLNHRKCWSPMSELKTSRENGIGLGQFTRAYNANGSIRFDKIAELREANPVALAGWNWDSRYDASYQLKGLVLANSKSYSKFNKLAASPMDAWRFTLAGYNGGDGSVMQSRLMCASNIGCNKSVWYGNVELHSNKSRAKWKGYGESAFDINRGYVRKIEARSPYYKQHWEKLNDIGERHERR
jgi:hypothetical protein